jgi:hypothetical protein
MRNLWWKLPLILSLGLAMTSCSTTGHLQNMPASPTQSAPHHQQIVTQQPEAKPVTISKHDQPVQQQVHTHKTTIKTITKAKHPHKQAIKNKAKSKPVTTKVKPAGNKEKPAPVMPKQVAANQSPMTVDKEHWVLYEQSINFEPRTYRHMGKQRDVIGNLEYLDRMNGNHHYIQIVRWDGANINQSYINARAAIQDAIIGLTFLNNSYIETNLGPAIMVLGGSAYIFEIPGHPIELILIPAKAGPPMPLEKSLLPRTKMKREPLQKYSEMFDGTNQGICAYIQIDHDTAVAIYALPTTIGA